MTSQTFQRSHGLTHPESLFQQPASAVSKSPKSPRRHPLGGNAAPAFVELLTASTGMATSCVVEVESASGGKLRLDLKTIATSQLAELIRAFAAS